MRRGVSRDGCNAMNILRAAKKYGLACDGYTKDVEGLYKLKMPCIIHWNFNHFVVLEGFQGGYAYLNAPGVGRRKLNYEDFDDAFTGAVLGWLKLKYERELGELGGRLSSLLFQFINGISKLRMAGVENRAAYEYTALYTKVVSIGKKSAMFDRASGLFQGG